MGIRKKLFLKIIAVVFIFGVVILLKSVCEASEHTDNFILQKNISPERAQRSIASRTDKFLFYNRINVITLEPIILYLEKQKNSPPLFACTGC